MTLTNGYQAGYDAGYTDGIGNRQKNAVAALGLTGILRSIASPQVYQDTWIEGYNEGYRIGLRKYHEKKHDD